METVAANVQPLIIWNRSMAVALEKAENGSEVEDMYFIEKLRCSAALLGYSLTRCLEPKTAGREKRFFIVNDKRERLSSFERNDLVTKNQLRFRKDCWMFFTTREEAQATLGDIIANCRQQRQAKKLSIIEDCQL